MFCDPPLVTPGLDPGVQGERAQREEAQRGWKSFYEEDAASRLLDCRVKPGNDVIRKRMRDDLTASLNR